ncbi:MAG: DUF4381 domain-containing protein [Bacteroidales bacterium]
MINIEQNINDSISDLALANLQPLYEPSVVKFTFESVGWRILAVLCLIITLLVAFISIRRYVQNSYRRKALSILNNESSAIDIFVLLKQLAIQVYGRQTAGSLYGKEWLIFLDKTGVGVSFVEREADFLNAVYNTDAIDISTRADLLTNAKKWIKTHAR